MRLIRKWKKKFLPKWLLLGYEFLSFRSEFQTLHGTHCSQIDDLGLFCSDFLSVHGTHRSQIDDLTLFCVPMCAWNALLPNFLDFSKNKTRWTFCIFFSKIVHQKGLFEKIKKNSIFWCCLGILDIYGRAFLSLQF